MKPEPLKDKTYNITALHNTDIHKIRLSDGISLEYVDRSVKLHKRKDIKSAVEWLKQELNEEFRNKTISFAYGSRPQILWEKIHKAFEDVLNKKPKER